MARRKITDAEKTEMKRKKDIRKRIDSCKGAMESSLKQCMRTIERGDIRTPPYVFKKGDRVSYGAWKWSAILEVLEGGKLYKVFSITDDIQYGVNKGASFKIEYHLYTQLRPYVDKKEVDKREIFLEKDDIRFQYSQRDMRAIFGLVYGGSGLDMNPEYQRGLVWTDKQKESLIDSIFRNIDIGKFAIIRRKFSEDLTHFYEVLDGKQRIQTLIDFYECRFTYKGKTFNELHWMDRNHFVNYSISWAETEPLTNEQKYRYFLKLNVSGVPISKEHLERVKEMWIKERLKNEKI